MKKQGFCSKIKTLEGDAGENLFASRMAPASADMMQYRPMQGGLYKGNFVANEGNGKLETILSEAFAAIEHQVKTSKESAFLQER